MSDDLNKSLKEELERIQQTLREVPKLRIREKNIRNLLGLGKVYKYPKKEKPDE